MWCTEGTVTLEKRRVICLFSATQWWWLESWWLNLKPKNSLEQHQTLMSIKCRDCICLRYIHRDLTYQYHDHPVTLLLKSLVSHFCFKEMNTYIQQKTVLLHCLFLKESWKHVLLFQQTYQAAQLFLTITRNVCWAPNQHIRMISEGSCDTEDWSNGFTHIKYILKYIKTENILNCNL